MRVKIPYSTGYKEIELDDARVKGVLNTGAHEFKADLPQEEIIRRALEHPIHSSKLCIMAKNAKSVLIITSDHTRPVPSMITMPLILQEVRSLNPDVVVKILIATGFHRLSTCDEMVGKFGRELVEKEEIIYHDSRRKENMVYKGNLPSGGELWLNSLIDWADLVIAEGFIEPHFFAGFSGGRKSILPGIAAEKTVLANHCSKFIAHRSARVGILEGNPIHKDMLFAARVAKLKFIMNVAIDEDKRIINVFAGHSEEAHKKGCEFVGQLAGVNDVQADIVITSNGGYPLDQNIYQAVKGMTAAEACAKENGVIIMVAACNDGHGGEAFYEWFANAQSPEAVSERIAQISQEDTIPDQWEAQILARVLLKCKVILVTDMCDPDIIKNMHMLHAATIEEALEMADDIMGKSSSIVVIPDGVGIIVTQN